MSYLMKENLNALHDRIPSRNQSKSPSLTKRFGPTRKIGRMSLGKVYDQREFTSLVAICCGLLFFRRVCTQILAQIPFRLPDERNADCELHTPFFAGRVRLGIQ